MSAQPDSDTEPITVTTALGNASRLLCNAELEPDLKRMERVERLADSWINIAGLLSQRDQNA